MSAHRYEVLSKIAEGGLGSVFKAYDRNLQREVAIKRVKAETPEQAEKQAQELMAEAKTLSTLQHPHIVTIFDVGTDEEGNFIVMELLKGETLEDIVERGALNEEDFDQLVQQSIEGMIAAHDSGLIHLDIKPQNFMVIWLPSGKFQIKVLDFGLAKISQQPFVQETDEDGTILGSIYFMAPEQFEQQEVDVRTDLYSLGCVYYFALTQHYPFQGETGAEVMASHLYHSLVPLADLRPDLPSFVHRWIDWLMARNIGDRPKSAQEAWDTFKSKEFPFEKLVAKAAAPTPNLIRPPSQQLTQQSQPLTQRSQQLNKSSQRLRQAPSTHVPGYTQALQNKLFPSPIAKPFNVSSAAAPHHLQKKEPLPLWMKVWLPLGLFLILASVGGTFFWIKQRENSRYHYLSNAEEPSGSFKDVKLLLKFLDDPETSKKAAQTLSKLHGINNQHLQAATLFKEVESPQGIGQLASVLAQRGVEGSVPSLLHQITRTKDAKARQEIWTAISTLASTDDLKEVLSHLQIEQEPEQHIAAQAIVTILQKDKDPSLYLNAIAEVTQNTALSEFTRAAAIESLGIIGSPNAFEELSKFLKNDNAKLRGAAAIAARHWPNGAPLDALQQLIAAEFQSGVRLSAIQSFAQLTAKSAPFSQDQIKEMLQLVYTNTREPVEENALLPASTSVISPKTLTFLESVKAQKKELTEQILQFEKQVNAALAKITAIHEDESIIPAATFENKTETVQLDGPNLTQWQNGKASWLMDFARPGKYQVQLKYQNSDQRQTLLVTLGDAIFRANTEVVSSSTASLTLGTTQIKDKGVFRLVLSCPLSDESLQKFKITDWTLIRLGD